MKRNVSVLFLVGIALISKLVVAQEVVQIGTWGDFMAELKTGGAHTIKFTDDITVENDADIYHYVNHRDKIVIDGDGHGINGMQQPLGNFSGYLEIKNVGNEVGILDAKPNNSGKFVPFTETKKRVKYAVVDKSFNNFQSYAIALTAGSLKISNSIFYKNTGELFSLDKASTLEVYDSFFISNVNTKAEASSHGIIYSPSLSSKREKSRGKLKIVDSTFIDNKNTLDGEGLEIKIIAEKKDTVFYGDSYAKMYRLEVDAKAGRKIFIGDNILIHNELKINEGKGSAGKVIFGGPLTISKSVSMEGGTTVFKAPLATNKLDVNSGNNIFIGSVTSDYFRIDGGTNIFGDLIMANSQGGVIVHGGSNTFNGVLMMVKGDKIITVLGGESIFNHEVKVDTIALHNQGVAVFNRNVFMSLLSLLGGNFTARAGFDCTKVTTKGGVIDLQNDRGILNKLNFGKIELKKDLWLSLNTELTMDEGKMNPILFEEVPKNNGHHIYILPLKFIGLSSRKIEFNLFEKSGAMNEKKKALKREKKILSMIEYKENILPDSHKVQYNDGRFTFIPEKEDLDIPEKDPKLNFSTNRRGKNAFGRNIFRVIFSNTEYEDDYFKDKNLEYSHNPSNSSDPEESLLVATSVGMQTGNVLAQLNSFRMGLQKVGFFVNKDTGILVLDHKPTEEVFNEKVTDQQGRLNFKYYQEKRLWVNDMATLEKVPLELGPEVKNSMYSVYCGANSSITYLEKGWGFEYGVYGGYHGSHSTYDSVEREDEIIQDGLTLGLVGVAYKGDFFTGITINGGGARNEFSTQYGTDNTSVFMLGVATKMGYNLKYKEDTLIVQPGLFFSYSFINSKDYTNSAGAVIKSQLLQVLHLEPEVKVLCNLKNCTPYVNLSIAFDFFNNSEVWVDNLSLVRPKIKPYVRYGVGLEKNFSARFALFLQGECTFGGRNGVSLQVGGKISLL